MDIRMPRLDGINALRIIRRISPHLPVIMFTGQAGQGDMLESTRLGAFTCLVKPLAIDKFVQALEQALLHENNTAGHSSLS
jgi:DNA-binding NtrC family response regulator